MAGGADDVNIDARGETDPGDATSTSAEAPASTSIPTSAQGDDVSTTDTEGNAVGGESSDDSTPSAATRAPRAASARPAAKRGTASGSPTKRDPADTRTPAQKAAATRARKAAAAKAAAAEEAALESPAADGDGTPPAEAESAGSGAAKPPARAPRTSPATRRRTSPSAASRTASLRAAAASASTKPAADETTEKPVAAEEAVAEEVTVEESVADETVADETTADETSADESTDVDRPELEGSVSGGPLAPAGPEGPLGPSSTVATDAPVAEPATDAPATVAPATNPSASPSRLSTLFRSARSRVQERLDEARAPKLEVPIAAEPRSATAPEPVVEPESEPEPLPESEHVVEPEPIVEPEPLGEAEVGEAPVAVAVESPAPDPAPPVAEQAAPTRPAPDANAPVVLSIRGLVKRYGSTTAVENVDLEVRAGSFYGIVGPNGAGKTTTLSIATGLLRPDAGTVTILGTDVWSPTEAPKAKRSLGVLPDRLRLFDRLTGAQFLYYAGTLRGLDGPTARKRSADLADAFGLNDALGRLVSDYSVGMTKKVALAAAIIHSPRVLILDEPFESVDPVSAATVTEILQRYVRGGGTVLLSSHSMDLVERICDNVAVIVDGHVLASGTVDEVREGRSLQERFIELAGGGAATEGMEWLHSFSD
jgi:ABC-2 type transport system ATP-binding protein